MNIGGEARDTHEALVIHLKDSLKVCVNSHQLSGKAGISRDRNTVLAGHCYHHISVVLVLAMRNYGRDILTTMIDDL